jgi:malonate transporter
MIQIFTALIPVFALIGIGYLFKRLAFPSREFWPLADRFTYYVLMPALLVYKLSAASTPSPQTFDLVYSGLGTILLIFFLLLLLEKLIALDGPAFTSVAQGGIRFNTYVYLGLIDAMYGDQGLILAAILITFAIPLINLLCISFFALYTGKGSFSVRGLVRTIATNPLILACLVGGAINFSGLTLPLPLTRMLGILSNAALPLGLLSVGVGLEIRSMASSKKALTWASVIKLLLFPALITLVGIQFGLSGTMLAVVTLFGAMPTAVSSYILARELGGDLKLMSSIITFQTLASIGTIALVIQVLERIQ